MSGGERPRRDARGPKGKLSARDLETWLLRSGFAERDGGPGLLAPTELGRELGGALAVE